MLSKKRAVLFEDRLLDAPPDETGNIVEPDRTQKELRTSEIRYRRLFEAARDGILILNAVTLKITEVNPFMTGLLGYSHDEFLGKELWEIGLFSDKEASQSAFRTLQATGYIRYEHMPLQTTEGKLREVEFVSNVYTEGDQQVIQCNIRDITDRKRREEERAQLLENAQAAHAEADTASNIKDEFLATLSHELRTPLTAILGWSNMLASNNLDPLTTSRALETIIRNARAQRQLIDDLLDISRIITGKLRLALRHLELAPMIAAVLDTVRPAAEAKRLELRLALDPHLKPILGDPDRLQQIVWNLLSNAIKFTPEGGRVEVRLEQVDAHVELTISDTGQGIDPELLLHVFDRFRQSDSSSTRRHGGLGLGLSIVRQLVELHGGIVTAESAGAGAGSSFKVMLPLESEYQEVSAVEVRRGVSAGEVSGPERVMERAGLGELRVLVVDDEADARELVATVLSSGGAEVVAVETAAAALKALEAERFDVMVADIGMPEVDGYGLISCYG